MVTLPNKCDFCGLRAFYKFSSADETHGNDQAFAKLRLLHDRRIVGRKFPRNLEASNTPGDFGTTSFCAVASRAWNKNESSCPHWTLLIRGASIADYLSPYQDQRTFRAAFLSVVITILSLIVAVLSLAVALLK
jgi:hypothetical protein